MGVPGTGPSGTVYTTRNLEGSNPMSVACATPRTLPTSARPTTRAHHRVIKRDPTRAYRWLCRPGVWGDTWGSLGMRCEYDDMAHSPSGSLPGAVVRLPGVVVEGDGVSCPPRARSLLLGSLLLSLKAKAHATMA